MLKLNVIFIVIFVLIIGGCNGSYSIIKKSFLYQRQEKRALTIKKLDLSRMMLTNTPSTIAQFKNLEELDLSFNEMLEFPTEICKLKNLKKLNLTSNNIKVVPKCIGKLEKLEYLNLRLNKVEKLPKEITNLKSLNLLVLEGHYLLEGEIELLENILPWVKIDFRLVHY